MPHLVGHVDISIKIATFRYAAFLMSHYWKALMGLSDA